MSDVCERLENMAEDYFKFKIDALPSDSLTRQVSESYIADIESAIAEIERLRSGWISVEDRLPEPFNSNSITEFPVKLCLVYRDCDWIEINAYHYDKKSFDRKDVTHWMPLPQPPEEPK